MRIQDGLGFWIPVFVSGTWILDSLSCIPDFKTQDSRFHKPKFPGLRNLDSLTLGEIWNQHVQLNAIAASEFNVISTVGAVHFLRNFPIVCRKLALVAGRGDYLLQECYW